jgi:signal peptidase I
MEIKKAAKKTWHFLWHEDSLASWLVSLAIAFLLAKFIFFPSLSLILATSMPLVVVESGSMHHPGSFAENVIGSKDSFELWWQEKGKWYAEKGIEKQEAAEWPLKTGLEIGDIVLVSGHSKPKVGDIIIFNAGQKHPLIHRIVEIKEINKTTYYSTKGDNNSNQLISEKQIPEDNIIGKAVLRIPKLGWIKLAFIKFFQALK